MRLPIVIAVFILSHNLGVAQSRIGISGYGVDSSDMAVGIMVDYQVGSTALTNRLYTDFLQGNFIEKSVLDKASKRLVKFNKAGGDGQYGVYFAKAIDSLMGKSGFSYFVSVTDRIHADALFTDDLFTVLFYGNKPFEGDTAEMGTFSANYLHYQQLQVGLIKQNKNKSTFGVGMAFLKGQEFYQMSIARANLYTSTLGNSNDLDLLYRTVESDPRKKRMSHMNGWGLALDAFYQVPYYVLQDGEEIDEEGKWKGFLRIEANDLGFIQWNDSSMTRVKDSVFHNEGIWISSALTLPDTWADDQADSLNALVEPTTLRGTFASILPGSLHLKMHQENGNGTYIEMGTLLRLFANYSPLIYLAGGQEFSEKLTMGGVMEFGGYGRFNLGLQASTNLSGYELSVGSRGLGGFFFPQSSGSNTAFLSVKKKF